MWSAPLPLLNCAWQKFSLTHLFNVFILFCICLMCSYTICTKKKLSEPSIVRTVAVTVLLGYFVAGVCTIRVVQQSSVYKSMGFIYPNKFTYLNTFVIQLAHKCSENGGPTVFKIYRCNQKIFQNVVEFLIQAQPDR